MTHPTDQSSREQEREAFEAWFEADRLATWVRAGCDKDRGPRPSENWGRNRKEPSWHAWQARAALSGNADEAAEIIGNLVSNIEAHGMYSKESTLGFLTQAFYCLRPEGNASIVGLRQDDALTVSGDVDQGVAMPAAATQEVAADLINLRGDEAEEHLQAAGSALPHGADSTAESPTLPPTAITAEEAGREGEAKDAWISVHDRVPAVGQEVLVFGQSPWEKAPSIKVDLWDEIHEAPVSFSSATVCVGEGWTENDSDDITHWQPLPPAPAQSGGQG